MDESMALAVLSERERQVLTLSTQGFTDKLIARELELSLATVHTYWVRIKSKLGGATRAEIVAEAVRSVAENKNDVLIEEIRRRAKVEEELMASYRLLQSIIDATPDLIFVKDLNGRYEWVNRTFQEAANISADQIIGATDFELVAEESALKFRKGDQEAVRSGSAIEQHDIFEAPGKTHYYHTIKFPLFDDSGKTIAVGGVSREVTSRIESELRAQHMDERLAIALEAANLIIWEWDMTTNQVYWSANTESVHGVQPGSFDGTFEGFQRLVAPEDLPNLLKALDEAINITGEYEAEFRTARPDGELQWIMGKGKVMYDEGGKPARLAGIGLDVTRRKVAEDKLSQSSGRLSG